MQHEPTPAPAPGHRSGRKRCPSCQANKSLSEFYVTPSGAPSGYCRTCQKAISRRSRKRRNAAIRALIALHPEAWRDALRTSRDHDHDEQVSGGGPDVA